MYPENLIVPVESIIPMDRVYACLALGSPSRGNLIRHDRILSSWHPATPLEVRRGESFGTVADI